jgi:hypothetical protein
MKYVTTLILVLMASALSAGTPLIEVETGSVEFGMVSPPLTVYHTQWLKTSVADTIFITDIKTGCDCAVISLSSNTLPPGDSVMLTMAWEISRIKRLDTKTVRIFDQTETDPARIRYQAKPMQDLSATKPISMKPFRFEFTEFGSVVRDSIPFALTNNSDDIWRVSVVIAPSELVSYTVPDSIPPGEKAEGMIKMASPTGIDNRTEDCITLQFEAADQKPIRMTLPIVKKVYGKPAG